MSLFTTLLSLCSPTSCILCQKGDILICSPCRGSLCPSLSSFEDTLILFSYRDANIKTLLRHAKYSYQPRLYKELLQNIIRHEKYHTLSDCDVIIPIPMHPFRKMMRGQNHSEKIAYYLNEILSVPISFSLMKRSFYTKRQALLSRRERLSRQKNSFHLSQSKETALKGKHILLVDDIMTTGSTLEEAKKVLLAHGAKKVTLFVLAH